ncbi:PH domain-containing protein [Clostridium sp. CX1]|uniref:PH domain-containing protein n=1 Tax=Clostridium sp. CX1 TaxID=2978346 RepID=UPI0021BF9DD3|nr:PH domain-containing protein [Clostridium sp. CX1]MCT8976233.1 PH domain-containing protein [Clostridium sp. CX1]
METYKSIKGKGIYPIVGISVLYNIFLVLLLFVVNSYEISIILKITIIVFNIYQLYYIIICTSLNYSMDKENLYITSSLGIKNIKIPFSSIQGYKKAKGYIKGVKLSGYGKNHFAIGRAIIEKIGSTYMFVTSTENIIYLKTEDMNYGLSPEDFNKFEKELRENDINEISWEHKANRNINLYKDKKFFVPFIIVAVLSLTIALNPILLYLYNMLPAMMPLNFDSQFLAIKLGTGKQFAFKQMVYGLLNMAILFCMYYAAYFCAKYDRKSSYKFIYISLIISITFFIMQIRILLTFR